MRYVYILGVTQFVETFKYTSQESLSLGDIDRNPEGSGLMFDMESVSSILVWLHDNKDIITVSANIISVAMKFFSQIKTSGNDLPGQPPAKPDAPSSEPSKATTASNSITIIIRMPDGRDFPVEIDAKTTESDVLGIIKNIIKLDNLK